MTMANERVDVAVSGGDWDNPLLRNYALAMRALDALPMTEPQSWKFLGAMHGFDRDLWTRAGVIDAHTVIPASLTDDTFGDQCQHSTWYFLPWHRGYLFAFEAIVAAKVKELTGEDWVLPYWNYLDETNPDRRKVPEAFTAATLWDGTPNPLITYPRANNALPPVPPHRDINLGAMKENDFTVGANGTLGLGGGTTGFAHFGDMAGEIESNPHNAVHGMVGGFMGNPYLAGLDPLFWLHHCNIDRLWDAWMSTPGKNMTRESDWLDGPGPIGRTFIMPGATAGDAPFHYTARDTLRDGTLHRRYDDLRKGTGVSGGGVMVAHVNMGAPEQQRVETLGANEDPVELGSAPAETHIALQAQATTVAVQMMGASTLGSATSRLYLALESIRGNAPYATVDVYVNVPDDGTPEAHVDHVAGSLHLFGLDRASVPDGGHGGNGLGQTLDITDLADRLTKAGGFDPAHLKVTLVPVEGSSDDAPITVEKVSVLERTGIATLPAQ
jgi:tyrosinase